MKHLNYFYIVTLLAFFCGSMVQARTKELGGGNFCKSDKAYVLCDQAEMAHVQVLQMQDLESSLELITLAANRVGFDVAEWLSVRVEKRRWVLTQAPFNRDECGLQSPDVDENVTVTNGCQDQSVVFIQSDFWQSATPQLRADLVMHEILMSFAIDFNRPHEIVREAFRILNGFYAGEDSSRNRDRLYFALKYPYLPLLTERASVIAALSSEFARICQSGKFSELDWLALQTRLLWARTQSWQSSNRTKSFVYMKALKSIGDLKKQGGVCERLLTPAQTFENLWAANLSEGREIKDSHQSFSCRENCTL
jgi:hypothetical protein